MFLIIHPKNISHLILLDFLRNFNNFGQEILTLKRKRGKGRKKSVLLVVFLHLQFRTQCKARFRFFHPWNSFFSSHTLIRFSRPGRRHYQGRNMNFKNSQEQQTEHNFGTYSIYRNYFSIWLVHSLKIDWHWESQDVSFSIDLVLRKLHDWLVLSLKKDWHWGY